MALRGTLSTAMLTDLQLAYLAGLIDGEGSIESQREWQPRGATPRFPLRVSFTFATEEPLKTISGWLGRTYKQYLATSVNRSPRYRMHIPKGIAVIVLGGCLPFLLLKRRQAELILAIEAVREANNPGRVHIGSAHLARMPEAAVEEMAALHTELRSLKSHKRGVRQYH